MPPLIPIHAVRKQAELCLGLLRDLESAVARGHPLDQQLAQHYRQHREFGSRDRRFFSALAFAWFRWRGWLTHPAQPDASDVVAAWRLDAPVTHPAIDLLAGTLPPLPDSFKTLSSVTLHEKAALLGPWLKRPPPELDALLPAWFADALYYPDDTDRTEHRRRCLQSFQVRPPTWLRVRAGREAAILARLNPSFIAPKQDELVPDDCKTGTPTGLPANPGVGPANHPAEAAGHAHPTNNQSLADRMAAATPHPRLPQALCMPKGCNLETLNHMPEVEIQDVASQCVGLACAPHSGERWWDACAGSGGKSFHLADLMHGQGSVLATDPRESSLKECRRRIVRNRAQIIMPRAWNGELATAPDRLFDGVLVDAPCSGIGTWHRNPDARWRTPPGAVSRHAERQARLLKTCADRVRPGGRLVYSVCTLAAAETVDVVHSFLAEHGDFRIESPPHPLTGAASPGPVWIWPWESNGNGMFIARLRRA